MKMYLYTLYGYEENIVLSNENSYTEEEFERMCKEAPIEGLEIDLPFYSSSSIRDHLIKEYNFKRVIYQAGFFFDKDVE